MPLWWCGVLVWWLARLRTVVVVLRMPCSQTRLQFSAAWAKADVRLQTRKALVCVSCKMLCRLSVCACVCASVGVSVSVTEKAVNLLSSLHQLFGSFVFVLPVWLCLLSLLVDPPC